MLKERYGSDVRIKAIATERSMWRRRFGRLGGDRGAIPMIDGIVTAIEERLLWNRFGL